MCGKHELGSIVETTERSLLQLLESDQADKAHHTRGIAVDGDRRQQTGLDKRVRG
jgi:hypothetical protein